MRAGWASVLLATSLACASVTRRVDPVSVLSTTESEVYRSPERAFLMLTPSWPYVDVKLVEASDCAVERTTTYEATETTERHSEGLPLVDLGNGGSGPGDALVFLAAVGGPMAADAAISSGAERSKPRETPTMLTRRRVRLEPNCYAHVFEGQLSWTGDDGTPRAYDVVGGSARVPVASLSGVVPEALRANGQPVALSVEDEVSLSDLETCVATFGAPGLAPTTSAPADAQLATLCRDLGATKDR